MNNTSDNSPHEPSTEKRSRMGFFIGTAIFLVMVALLIFNTPRGYDMNLTQIGNGSPSLVLVFDPNLVICGEMMAVLDQIRPEFESKLQILVADVGRAEGREFSLKHGVEPPGFVMFAESGTLVKSFPHPLTADELTLELQSAFGW
jgi:hypothetical protein